MARGSCSILASNRTVLYAHNAGLPATKNADPDCRQSDYNISVMHIRQHSSFSAGQ